MKNTKRFFFIFCFSLFLLFVTNSCKKQKTVAIPEVSTIDVSSVDGTSASSGGKIISDGNGEIVSRGVCWSNTITTPTISDNKTIDGTGIGNFSSQISGLTGLTTYYVRAYATNEAGTSYGPVKQFTTLLSEGVPYQGGVIAHVLQQEDPGFDPNVQHGIIASINDLNPTQWYNGTFVTVGASDTQIGSGNSNTDMVVLNQGAGNYAAKLCSDLVLNGYNDWYLPSQEELKKLRENYLLIGGFNSGSSEYWSSSEISDIRAVAIEFFSSSGVIWGNKLESYNVRPVRSF